MKIEYELETIYMCVCVVFFYKLMIIRIYLKLIFFLLAWDFTPDTKAMLLVVGLKPGILEL